MNWADYAILALLGLSVLVGLWRGFLAEVLALATWVAAFWLAWLGAPRLAQYLPADVAAPSLRLLIAGGACFLVVVLLGGLLGFFLRKLVAGSGLSGTDRLLGLVFGLARGLALVVLAVLLLGFTPFPRDPWWQESRLLPSFVAGADWLNGRLPATLAGHLDALAPPPAPAPPVPAAPATPAAPTPAAATTPSPNP